MKSQMEELRKEKERLEAENRRLHESDAALQTEVDQLREEAAETGGRQEMETLLNEQRQLHEDLQAELEEALERGASLGDRCSSLEDQLIKVMEEAELERLRASTGTAAASTGPAKLRKGHYQRWEWQPHKAFD